VDADEWTLHKNEAEVFERCISELVADLSKRNDPPKRKTR
jgi:hypothetical protein